MKILIYSRASPTWLRSISCRNLSCNIARCRAPESAMTGTTRIGCFFWSDWRNCGGIIRIGLNESNGLLTNTRVNKAGRCCAQANGSRRESVFMPYLGDGLSISETCAGGVCRISRLRDNCTACTAIKNRLPVGSNASANESEINAKRVRKPGDYKERGVPEKEATDLGV